MKASFAVGLLCIGGVVTIWVVSSVALQVRLFLLLLWLADSCAAPLQWVFHELDYAKPFFATYVSTSLFIVYLLGFLVFPDWKCDRFGPRSWPGSVQ